MEQPSSPVSECQPLSGENGDGVEETIMIGQLDSGSSFRIPITVQSTPVLAIVDTAAEVTIISEDLFKGMKSEPPVLRRVRLNTAGKNLEMHGRVIGPIQLELGNMVFEEDVYVAPIRDDMLLGLDFMRKHGATLAYLRLRSP